MAHGLPDGSRPFKGRLPVSFLIKGEIDCLCHDAAFQLLDVARSGQQRKKFVRIQCVQLDPLQKCGGQVAQNLQMSGLEATLPDLRELDL